MTYNALRKGMVVALVALATTCIATAATAGTCSAGSVCLPTLDFEKDGGGLPLPAGAVVDHQWGTDTLPGGITVTTGQAAHPAMIFDSANPTGGDWDLGTPNQDFGGPGSGSGGRDGQRGQNALPLGKIVIISEDGSSSDPDDNACGGTLTFTFPKPVYVNSVQVLDIDEGMAGDVVARDASGSIVLAEEMLNNRGNNSVQRVYLKVEGVKTLEVFLPGSGAVSEIDFCDQSLCVPDVDFETRAGGQPLYAGDIIDGDAGAIEGMTVTTNDPAHKAMIFDSGNPTGGDTDLGTSNEDLILIISEDNDQLDPDDNAGGGTLTFDFDVPSYVESIDILDIDCGETSGTIRAFDAGGAELLVEPLLDVGNNQMQTVPIGIGGISRLEVYLPSSGAVTRIRSCECDATPIKLTFGKKQTRWVIKNTGSDPLVIDRIHIEWPPINGNLKKIKLGSQTVWTGNLPPYQATLTADDLDELPRLAPGQKRPLRFIFQRVVDKSPEFYTIDVDFAQGCGISRQGTEPLPECSVATGSDLIFASKQIRWQLTNAGIQTVKIDAVNLDDWPTAINGELRKLLLGSQTIATTASADLPDDMAPAQVTDFDAATSLTLAPGESQQIKLQFENVADLLSFYDLAVDITTTDDVQACPVGIQQGDQPCDVSAAEALDITGSSAAWDLTNDGLGDAVISNISLNDWPEGANGALVEIKLDDVTIWDVGAAAPPLSIDAADLIAAATVAAGGSTGKLELVFENPADAEKVYDLAVTFESCSGVEINQGSDIESFQLAVTKSGDGSGTVTSAPAGIDCGADCDENYTSGTIVTLTATPDLGSLFVAWSGDADCLDGEVTIDAAKSCNAEFALETFQLTVTKSGDGSGTVMSTPAGIDCGADCDESYTSGAIVTLTATPDLGSLFVAWSGDADCLDGEVTMDAAKSCNAEFALETFQLTVTKSGDGSGTVTSAPAGIDCGADCDESYTSGTIVTLTPAPDAGSVFVGWTGDADCSDGEVAMDAAKSCDAEFAIEQFTLTVSLSGDGSGTVMSAPAGIDCGADCNED
ncbi:MAG: hypothetical protein GY719_27365, partial [bacterium]|nr:hypothetical protein [bacterium]